MTLLWGLIGLAWIYSPSLCVEGNPCEGTYKFLNESDRSGLIKSDLSKCDGTDLHGKWGWFRVSGDAGNALASNVPPSGTCGTEIRAYLEDAHPSFGVGKLTLTFCTATKSKSCQAKRDLEVINCGEFYLYNLFKFKENCKSKYWRYCTNGIADDKCTGDKCANGKRCVLKDNGNQHECVDAPSSGTQPQMMPPAEDPLSSNPCLNGSTCNNNSDPYTCLFGYSGDNCHINNYEDCTYALGMQSGKIPNHSVYSTSYWNNYTKASRGRLNLTRQSAYSGGWVARTDAAHQFLQIHLGSEGYNVVTGIATQGREDADQWVTKYYLQYKGLEWYNYTEQGGKTFKEFQGNTDRNGIVRHQLNPIIKANSFRFVVLEWHSSIAMRVELYGCRDFCLVKRCLNGGTCISDWKNDNFKCVCTSGYTDNLCGTPFTPDPCLINPCLNGGTCIKDGIDSYLCTCPPMYTGLLCAILQDFCSSSPCQNDGNCTNTPDGFKCTCRMWYTGNDCSTKQCHEPLGMQSGAIRDQQLIASSERDKSSIARFARLHYQYKNKPKSWVPVLDHGNQWLQVYLGNELTWVTGVATQGKGGKREAWVKKYLLRYWGAGVQVQFYKDHGEIHAKKFIANTDSSSVVHHELKPPVRASCFRFSATEWHNNIALRVELYGCKDACLSHPCLNGGTCNGNLTTGGYTCSCSPGYNGDRCEIGDVCSLSPPCLNGGTCSLLHNRPYFRCSCPVGFIGHDCWYHIPDSCSPYPCFNGGTCEYINQWPYFECDCPTAYFGYTCGSLGQTADPCSTEPCQNGGTCTMDSNALGFECSCPLGYFGFNCGLEQGDRCSDNPCKNDGTCTAENNLLGYSCNCTSEFVGFDCALLKDDPCIPNPCQNAGICTRTANLKDFTCNCTSEYTGDTCENKIVHGNWSDWTEWPNCNRPCNNGSRTRKRTCDNPAPTFSGKNCEGLPTETESCNLASCPAEMINYKLKLKNKDWNDNLADVESEYYTDLEDTIKKEVYNFYNKRDEDVIVVILEFRPGSVVSSFNVTYPGIDSLQIVSLQEEIAEGALGDTSAELLNITTTSVPEAPLILEATSTTSTSIELEWTAVSQAPSTPLLGYVIVYKEINQKFRPDIMKSVPPNLLKTVLKDLSKFTNYTIRVYAFTSSGNGVSSKAVSLRTQEDVPSEPPPNSVVKSTSENSIHVSWERISQGHVHGILLGYEVRYAKEHGSSSWVRKTFGVDEFEIDLKDLEYFTAYKVVVCARTSKGCGSEHSDIAYTFGDVPSKPPQSVVAERLKAAEFIKVTWSPVPFGFVNGLLMGYSVKYRRIVTAEKEVPRTEEKTVIAKSTDLFIILKVQTYSIYEIKVAAFTQKGMGPYSDYVYGETCRCPKILYTNYWSTSPYLIVNQQDQKFGGILSDIVIDMIYFACGICPEYGDTTVKTDSNGKGKAAFKKSLLGVLGDIDNVPQISFPIYGNEYITRFMGSHVYINLVESPGLAFIAVKRMPGTAARNMISAVLDCAPLVALSGCMAFIAGFVVWALDMKQNSDEFPACFSKGVGEGFWWSFISMTTVGYGDRSPRSVPARIFGIAWTLTGLVIISILIGAICSALTSSTVPYPVTLYGTKIGAIQNSTEQRVGILKNARVNEDKKYTNFEDLRTALEDGKVDGALIDTYVAAEHKDELFNDKIFVKEILDRPFGYGVVLSGAAVNVEQKCRDYISMQISEIFQIIQNTTKTLDPAPPDEAMEQSTGLFDGSSDMFLIAMASMIGMLGVAVIIGVIYQYKIFIPQENKVATLKSSTSHFSSKEAFIEEMREYVNAFYSDLSFKINARKEKNKNEIDKIKDKHTVGKKLGGSAKSSKIPVLVMKNPVYSASSSAENSFDVKRKLIRPNSRKSLLDQTQRWHSPHLAALNRAEVSSRSNSTSIDHCQRGMDCETTLHNSKAKKSYTKARRLNIVS